jgi:hypothetical protein
LAVFHLGDSTHTFRINIYVKLELKYIWRRIYGTLGMRLLLKQVPALAPASYIVHQEY